MTKRVLVCGSRGWKDAAMIERELLRASPALVIHGNCRGADRIADEIAKRHGIPRQQWPANWSLGRHAGLMRNDDMLRRGKPDVVLAFRAAGKSNGTDDMISRSSAFGVPVKVFHEVADDQA